VAEVEEVEEAVENRELSDIGKEAATDRWRRSRMRPPLTHPRPQLLPQFSIKALKRLGMLRGMSSVGPSSKR
jgi:hypothetical protein